MNKSIQDKMFAFIASRGAAGVTTEELAKEFLSPTSGPPALFAKLVKSFLASDPRVTQRADGRWAAPQAKSGPAPTSAYVAVETFQAQAGARTLLIDVGVVRIDLAGKVGAPGGAVLKPDPWPAGLILPPPYKELVAAGTTLADAVERAVKFCRGATLVCYRPGPFHEAVSGALLAADLPAPVLSLAALGRRHPALQADSIEELAAKLGVNAREPATAREMAQFTAELFSALLQRRQELHLGEPETWLEVQAPKKIEVDYSPFEFDKSFIDTLPERPGIYIMRDASGRALYVGKAANLRARLKSYFRARIQRDEKTERILEGLARVEVQETGSELAALLEEYGALQELEPPINAQYDAHDRFAAAPEKVARHRLALILPAPDPDEAEVFLIDADRALRRLRLPRAEPRRLRPLVEEFFFGPKPPEPADDREKVALQITWSWLDRNADRVNAFDVDLAGGLEPSLEILERYLKEEPGRHRVFHV